MTAATAERWWTTEASPQCVDWCDGDHAADEFAQGGGFTCCRTVIKVEGRFEVTVVAWIGVTDDETTPGQLEDMPPTIDVGVRGGITADEAFTLAQAIHAGVRLCDRTSRPQRT